MLKKVLLMVVLVLMLVPMFNATAQTTSLPETFVDPEGEYLINLPRNWRTVTGGFRLTIEIPNSISFLNLDIRTAASAVDALDFYVDLYGGEPEPIEIDDRDAAKMVLHEEISHGYYAIELAPRRYVVLAFLAARWEVVQREPTLLAMLASVRVPEPEEIPEEVVVELADALELEATYEDRTLTFDYPQDWFTSAYQGRVALSNVRNRAQYREPEFVYLNPEEVVVLVYPTVSSLPGIVTMLLDEDRNSAEDVALMMGIAVSVEGQGNNIPDVESSRINRQDAAQAVIYSDSEDYLVITLELDNGEVATIVAISEAGEMHLHQSTVEAMVATLALVE